MSYIAGRSALRAAPRLRPALRATPRLYSTPAGPVSSGQEKNDHPAEENKRSKEVLQKGAKRDPELIILLAVMCGAFSLVGWHFSRNPTTSNSENPVAKAENSEPWHTGTSGKYQYHPGGDTSQKKDAPSALNTVIIPNVNLPKELHEQFNKWGKDGF